MDGDRLCNEWKGSRKEVIGTGDNEESNMSLRGKVIMLCITCNGFGNPASDKCCEFAG